MADLNSMEAREVKHGPESWEGHTAVFPMTKIKPLFLYSAKGTHSIPTSQQLAFAGYQRPLDEFSRKTKRLSERMEFAQEVFLGGSRIGIQKESSWLQVYVCLSLMSVLFLL